VDDPAGAVLDAWSVVEDATTKAAQAAAVSVQPIRSHHLEVTRTQGSCWRNAH